MNIRKWLAQELKVSKNRIHALQSELNTLVLLDFDSRYLPAVVKSIGTDEFETETIATTTGAFLSYRWYYVIEKIISIRLNKNKKNIYIKLYLIHNFGLD